MCRSITTASGDSSSASSMAASPSAAVPTTASWGWRLMRGESASRNGWSSSASSTLIITAASAFRIAWEVSLVAVSSQPRRQRVAVIGAALDLGAGRRGVDMGPSAIRYAGLAERIEQLGRSCVDVGNVQTAVAEATPVGDERVRFLKEILQTCGRVADLVSEARAQGRLPLVLGGDHSVALGTLGGLARAHGPGGVLWIDAHGDLNRPDTSPTGNVHGMVLAAAMGLVAPGSPTPAGPFPRRRRASAAARAEGDGLHDERHRPAWDRAGDPRVVRADHWARLRPRQPGHGLSGPR